MSNLTALSEDIIPTVAVCFVGMTDREVAMSQTDTIVGASLFGNQWRMCRMQVYNWGTFCGYHDFPMMESTPDGKPAVIMITGESGTGKSTLLDAKTAVLMPYNVRFNAASNRTTKGRARSETERNVYSYLLGQQDNEVDETTGEGRERFLAGRPSYSPLLLPREAGDSLLPAFTTCPPTRNAMSTERSM